MKQKNTILLIAASLNLFTALLHLIAGQLDLVNGLMSSGLSQQLKSEWLGVWHTVTIVLFASSFYLLKVVFAQETNYNLEMIKSIGILYMFFSVPFIISSVYMKVLAPQWILLFPIGFLIMHWVRNRVQKPATG